MHGKWAQSGVPHKGWTCIDVDDLGTPDAVCEMCETQEIRYVHYMQHPDYPGVLGVGCVCAEHLEEDYQAPRQRERNLVNAARRRERWVRRRWKVSRAGNSYINSDGFNITVSRNNDGTWGGRIKDIVTGQSFPARRRYDSEDQAKLAAFNGIVFLKNKGWGTAG